jgi:hypothetical protein
MKGHERLTDVASSVNACDVPEKYDTLKLEYADKVLHVVSQSKTQAETCACVCVDPSQYPSEWPPGVPHQRLDHL